MSKSANPIAAYDESNAPKILLQLAGANPNRAFRQATMFGVDAPSHPSKIETPNSKPRKSKPAVPKGDQPEEIAPSVSRKNRARYKRVDNLSLSEILQALDSLDLDALFAAIGKPYTTGRRGYGVRAMFRSHIARYILDVQYVTDWREELATNPALATICGFYGSVPSEATFSRFNAKLAKCTDLTLALNQQLVDAIKSRVDLLHAKDPAKYPKFGTETSIDSTAIPAYSRPKRHPDAKKTARKRRPVGDKDAEWGKRHKADSPTGEMVWYYGYKEHILSDAHYEVPIALSTTTAKPNDIKELKPLFVQAEQRFSWFEPEYLMADKGYDGEDIHRFIRSKGTVGVIAIRKPTAQDGMYDGIFNADGEPTCMGMVGMEYVRTDPKTKSQLWRCRPEGCHLLLSGTKAITRCDSEEWFDPDLNPRVLTDIPRNSRKFKWLYSKRWSSERIFSSLKHSRLLEDHRYRGAKKVESHANVSVMAFLATVLTHLRQDDVDVMNWMKVRRA